METAGFSSNWKKLQQSLEQEKKTAKRKVSPSSPTHGKQRKPTSGHENAHKRRRMDKPTAPTSSKHNDAEALPEALTKPSVALAGDILNGGLTPSLEPGKYIALDCEMVGVGPTPENSSALARVSVVDFNGTQVYDSFVRPKEAVTDFRTPVSGITPALLRNARTFEEVQRDVAALMKERILVAHAVNNDLKALMLAHPRRDIRDTSQLKEYREMFGRRPALRHLARRVLGVEIQSGEHSSVEDARVTMALFRRHKDAFEREALARFGPAKIAGDGSAGKGGDGVAHGQGNAVASAKKPTKKKKKKGKR